MDSPLVQKHGTIYHSAHFMALKDHEEDRWDIYDIALARTIAKMDECRVWGAISEDEVVDLMHVMEKSLGTFVLDKVSETTPDQAV